MRIQTALACGTLLFPVTVIRQVLELELEAAPPMPAPHVVGFAVNADRLVLVLSPLAGRPLGRIRAVLVGQTRTGLDVAVAVDQIDGFIEAELSHERAGAPFPGWLARVGGEGGATRFWIDAAALSRTLDLAEAA